MQQSSSKVFETTLENAKGITSKRRDGNTTRLIDNAIQIIFQGKVCICLDHHEYGLNRKANKNLFEGILLRLSVEHSYLVRQKLIKADKDRLFIELLDQPMKLGKPSVAMFK